MFNVEQKAAVKETLANVSVSKEVSIYTRVMEGEQSGKTAIYIHGGGSGGNHTMLVRPAKWMIGKALFGKMILPDRRGEGKSSAMTQQLTIKDHAMDMKRLLDELGIDGKVTAMGISYGGPIALTLASMDERVDEVVLFASSPSLRSAKGLTGILNKCHVLERIVKSFYTKNVGKSPVRYADLDSIYDVSDKKQLNRIFLDAIKSTDKRRLESLLLQNASTLDPGNSSIDAGVRLDIPVYQVIGDKDEVWETDLGGYAERFPHTISTIVTNADHKASMLRAGEFYKQFLKIYNAA